MADDYTCTIHGECYISNLLLLDLEVVEAVLIPLLREAQVVESRRGEALILGYCLVGVRSSQ